MENTCSENNEKRENGNKKPFVIVLKVVLFVLIFFVLSTIVAFICKDDTNSYARTLFHEFYTQEKIDYLICGASHVSHGVEANIASEKFGKDVFNTGTPAQKIDGTYAILRQAVKTYKIEKVFMEADFAIACSPAFSERDGFTSEYIVSSHIKDFGIKSDFLFHCSSPKYFLNHIIPVGKDKLMTLNPKSNLEKIKSVVTGQYFKYEYYDSSSEYAGKGCVLDLDEIPDGGFTNTSLEKPIKVSKISDDWKNTIEKIIKLCKENDIELIFYQMPGSDFYLNEKGNYDEYNSFCRDFLNERGFKYFDFNLIHQDLFSPVDSDFYDDNHFVKKGVYKWTDLFCDFFESKYLEENALEKYFYSSYEQKMKEIPEKIFGLYMITSSDKKSMEIIPVTNAVVESPANSTNSAVSSGRITYDFYSIIAGEEKLLQSSTSENVLTLPTSENGGGAGKIRVISYLDGVKQNYCVTSFASF